MYALTYRRSYFPAPVRKPGGNSEGNTEQSNLVKNVLGRHRVQAKLVIGSANDRCEQEADRVAEQVMGAGSMLDHPAAARLDDPKVIRRTTVSPFSIEEGRLVSGEEETVQKKRDNSSSTTAVVAPAAKIQGAVQLFGQPLPDSTRTFMEQRFGQGFRAVRIHSRLGSQRRRL